MKHYRETVTLKARVGGGRLKFVRCECCNEKRTFPSFKKAEEHAKSIGSKGFKAELVRTYRI